VALSGDGGDELFGGYHLDRVLKQIRAIRLMRTIPGARRLAASIARRDAKRGYLARWDDIRHAEAGHLPGKIRYDLTLPLGRELMDGLLVDCMQPPYDRTLDAFYAEVPSHRGPLDAILSVLTRGWLPDNLLNHSDRMAMAHSVEMRVPFLDHPLTEFAFHLPEDMKIGARETKRVLKAYAAAAGLPRAVAYRRKAGFPVPWSEWIRGPLRTRVEEVLDGASWFEDYFHRDGIRRVMAQHQEGRDHGLLLWNLTVLAHWGERLVG
jgi:asparagine synthase (glutamine-hydrolysing)